MKSGGAQLEALKFMEQKVNEFLEACNGVSFKLKLKAGKCRVAADMCLNLLNDCLRVGCLEACKEALQLIPCNEMCLYRKGKAYLLLRDHKEASFRFHDALSVNAKHLKTFPKLNLWQDAILDALLRERKMFWGST
uniref:Uncharacterized protein n=1 Tax=Echinococcus canadensis TaxID=519352 RepID=A0A915EZB3_9CEST